jgi:hypothetical protein
MQSLLLIAWLNNISNENKKTANTVKFHLLDFEIFIEKQYGMTVDDLVTKLVKKKRMFILF